MAVAEKGGYDFEFVPELPEDYNCMICQCALRSPKQIETCGHRFCECCFQDLENWNKAGGNIQCPLDREVFKSHQVFSDKATERLILNWKVKCPNNKMGCSWIGELNTVEEHKKTCLDDLPNTVNGNLVKRVQKLEKEVVDKSTEIKSYKDEITRLNNEITKLNGNIASHNPRCSNNIASAASGVPVNAEYEQIYHHNYGDFKDFTIPFYFQDKYAFQLGFSVGDDDELSVSLYRCRGNDDPYTDYMTDEFSNTFKFVINMKRNNGPSEVLTITQNVWVIGNRYYRSLGDEYFIGYFSDFDIDGYFQYDYVFLT